MNTNPKVTYLTRRLSRAWKPIREDVKDCGFASWFDLLVKESRDGNFVISEMLRAKHKESFQRITEIQYDIRKELQNVSVH